MGCVGVGVRGGWGARLVVAGSHRRAGVVARGRLLAEQTPCGGEVAGEAGPAGAGGLRGAEYSPQAEVFPGACGSAACPRRRLAGPAWLPSSRRLAGDLAAVTASHRGDLAAVRACRAWWRSCLRSLRDGSVMVVGRTGHAAAGLAPVTAGQAAASVADGAPGWSTSGAGHGPAAAAGAGGPEGRARPGAFDRREGRPRTGWDCGGGLSRGRVTR